MNSKNSRLGFIYYQNLPYPVCFISRDKVLEGNKSFIHHFGKESINENVFSIFSIQDDQNNEITTLLDIALNKLYQFEINIKKLVKEYFILYKPMDEQKEILYLTFEEWKGNIEQVDDIIVSIF